MEFNPNTAIETEPEVEIDMEGGVSPYAPPEAYDPPSKDEEIPYEDMHPFLQEFIDDHNAYTKELNAFEATIALIEGGKVDQSIDERLRQFFFFFDKKVVTHNQEEEKYLFPRISKKMTETGEHSKADENFNVIDVLEDDHVKSIRVHIYREDNIIFIYAQKHFSDEELTEIQQKTKGA
jgi:hemerythrin superfamily protein